MIVGEIPSMPNLKKLKVILDNFLKDSSKCSMQVATVSTIKCDCAA